jgi:hypothetical protein
MLKVGGQSMKRTVGAMFLAAAVGGCMSANHASSVVEKPTVRASGEYYVPQVPGISGPWGEPVAMAAPYTSTSAHLTPWQAQRMMSQSVPLDWVQRDPNVMQAGAQVPGSGMPQPAMSMPPGGLMAPPGVPLSPPMLTPGGPGMPGPNIPMNGGPGGMGFMPGNNIPASASALMNAARAPMAGAAMGASPGSFCPPPASIGRTQIRFTGPDGMRISWLSQGADGRSSYSAPMVEAPGRYNFLQASIYRLKLSNIRGRPGLELYPTLEVVPSNPKTAAFLAHSAVPLEFTAQDFQEITEGKYLVKVIYLPDPQFQELAATGTDEIISTRLEPGADPILEAQRRGCILLVIRMGNVDQEAPNTPPLDSTGGNTCMMPPGMMLPGGPGVSPPAISGNAMLPNLPNSTPATSMAPAAPSIRPVSATQVLPDMPPRTPGNVAPAPPGPQAQNSANPMPTPPMPPSPMELSTLPPRQ